MYKFRDINLLLNKKLIVSLNKIYGISWYKINYLLASLGISTSFFINSLNIYYRELLIFYLGKLVLSKSALLRNIDLNILKLQNLQTYKGYRHKLSLPVHGQRTRSNANTQRSKRINS